MSGKRHGFHALVEGRLRRRRPTPGAGSHADVRRGLVPRPVRAGAVAGAVPRRQRLLDPARPRRRAGRADPQDVADRVPRVRRAAGDARDRGHPRPVRPAARYGPGRRCGDATSTRRARRRRTASRCATPSGSGAPGTRWSRRRTSRSDGARSRVQRREPPSQAGSGDHAGEVRDLLQLHLVQPGRRARARLQGRVGADQPRRHRDGSGAAHQDAAGRGDRPRAADRTGAAGADAHRQGAQHLRHRGELRRRPQRCRDQGCVRPDPRPAGAGARPARAGRVVGGGRQRAYHHRIQLWAAGFYKTEGLCWDAPRCGASRSSTSPTASPAAEVSVDGFTGATRGRRVDIVHDVGDSLSPLVDIGQIEGGFVQGVGWLTLEDLRWDVSDGPGRGRLATQAASTYKLPSLSEMPADLRVTLLDRAHEDGAVYGSKAVGEPPLMLAFAVREALRDACAAFGARRLGRAGLAGHARGGLLGDDRGADAAPVAADGLVARRCARAGSAESLRAGHRHRRARPRAAGGGRQDGGHGRRDVGERRRRQPRGGGRTTRARPVSRNAARRPAPVTGGTRSRTRRRSSTASSAAAER